jgi:hypothetical protein
MTYDGFGVEDAKGQITTYTYALDDALTGMSFSNATMTTPSVSFTYESAYARRATMGDGTGTIRWSPITPYAGSIRSACSVGFRSAGRMLVVSS